MTKVLRLLTPVMLMLAGTIAAQGKADSSAIRDRISSLLRSEAGRPSARIVRSYGDLLERFAVCRGDSVGANCRLTVQGPVFLLGAIRFRGDSAFVSVTEYNDTPSHGISGVGRTWVMLRRGERWDKLGYKSEETIWQR